MSELINLDGIDVLGELPPAIQSLTVFSAGISKGSASPEAARKVLGYMSSPAVTALKRRLGMDAA